MVLSYSQNINAILESYLAENIIESVENASEVNNVYLLHTAVIPEDSYLKRMRIETITVERN